MDIYNIRATRNATEARGIRIGINIDLSTSRPQTIQHLFLHSYEILHEFAAVQETDIYCIELTKLAKKMSIRQQVLATAEVYMHRYYLKVEIRRTNPYLVLCTAFYLACKVEECPQHIRLVVAEALRIWPGKPTPVHILATAAEYS
jgi:transcription initiation factor TFIIIB Brf1 subunit/transcription initiation factor TFIIB